MKMKIGLISRGRTCSTAIIQSIAAKYNISNQHEIYTQTYNLIQNDYLLRKKKSLELERDKFESELKNITNKLFSQNGFIVKIWPRMLIYPHSMSASTTFGMIKQNATFNITEYFKINQYDKLYFLDRDLHVSTASWTYSKKTHIFHYNKGDLTKPRRPIITINEKDYDIIRFYVLEYCLQQKLKKFLLDSNIDFEDITNNSLDLIDNSVATMRKTDNDYESLITNYDELQSFITDWYPICLENTKDWYYT
jgi:hypothetical protein